MQGGAAGQGLATAAWAQENSMCALVVDNQPVNGHPFSSMSEGSLCSCTSGTHPAGVVEPDGAGCPLGLLTVAQPAPSPHSYVYQHSSFHTYTVVLAGPAVYRCCVGVQGGLPAGGGSAAGLPTAWQGSFTDRVC
jgi:hypothetical protein